jgi:hypothetical protein
MNQATLMNCAFGRLWILFLLAFHPDLFKNLIEYFCGWRKRCELAYLLKQRALQYASRELTAKFN